MKAPEPIALSGEWVRLKPLSQAHAAEFFAIGQDVDIWQYLAPSPFETVTDAKRWIDKMDRRREETGSVTFSVFDTVSGELAGSSSFLDVRVAHAGIEIGYTWYGKKYRKTYVNTATKILMLEHAFDVLGANRVQLQTDARNKMSRNAIERLGAVQEGILRSHKIYPNGVVRDSALFSITRQEWGSVRQRLEAMIRSRGRSF